MNKNIFTPIEKIQYNTKTFDNDPYKYLNDPIFPKRHRNHQTILDYSAYNRLNPEPNS